MSDTSYTDSGDDTQQRFTQDFPDPGIVRKPPDVDPGIVAPMPRDASLPRSPMAGPHPADSNWDRFLFALSGPESSFGRNQVNRTSSARGWLQDIAGTRNQMIRQGLGDPWAGGRQNQFAVNRRYIERNFPQAAQAIARGDWNTAIRILAPNQWPSLPGGPQSTPQGVAMFNRALQRGPPQAFLGNPYPASPSDYGQPDPVLKTAQSTPGLGPPGYMPQPNELTGVLQQAMSGLMQNGSGRIAPMSLATMQFYANYLIAQRKGQSEAAKIQHARFQDQFKETLNAQQIELSRMGSCFSEAEKTKDPIGEFKQCMAAYSDSPNDPALQRALQGPNSWAQIKALLDWRHDNWLKGSKVKSQSDKQGQSNVWGTGDSDQSQQPDTSTQPSQPATTPSPTTSPAATTPPATQPAPATQPPPKAATTPQAITYQGVDPANQAAYNQQVTATAMGSEPTGEKAIPPTTQRDADDLLSRIRAATANVSPDQLVSTVRALNPTMGQDLQDMIDYGPIGSRSGTSASPRSVAYQSLMRGLASRADRNWYPGRGGNLTQFNADNSQSQKIIGRASRLYEAQQLVAADLQRLYATKDARGSPLINHLSGSLADALGNPDYHSLAMNWMALNQEVDAITHGGTATVTDLHERETIYPWYTNAASFRQAINNDAHLALSVIDQQQGLFNRLGGHSSDSLPSPFRNGLYQNGTATGLQSGTVRGFNNLTRLDRDTGAIRDSASIPGGGPPIVGQVYQLKPGKLAIWTGGGNPANLVDPNNWESY